MLCTLILLICVCLSLVSNAEELDSPQLVRFATGTVTPWVYLDEEGGERGVLVEFSKALALYSGMPYVNILQPYPRALQSLASGYVDCVVAFQSSSVAETAILVSDLSRSRILMVVRKGEMEKYKTPIADGKRIGLIRGSDYDLSRRNRSTYNLFPVSNMHQGLELLIKNRIDVMVGTEEAFSWAIREMKLGSDDLELVRVIGEAGVGLYLSKHSPREELIEVYRQALNEMRKDGKLERIFKLDSAFGVDTLK